VAFHDIIFKAAGNPRLTQMINNLAEQMYRYRFEYIKDESQHQMLIKEHCLICETIEKRDVEGAKEAIRKHIENQENSIIRQIRLEKR
jgi:DNA-binding GntR family transcriptional regulator